jgi:hypothetical protein
LWPLFAADGFNFDKLKSGELHEKHKAGTWKLGTVSAFA